MRLAPHAFDPLIGAIADSGQLAKLSLAAGADFLLALSVARVRSRGISPLAAYLPIHHSNQTVEELVLREILPAVPGASVVVGLMPEADADAMQQRLVTLQNGGITAITNYPSISLVDGSLRSI